VLLLEGFYLWVKSNPVQLYRYIYTCYFQCLYRLILLLQLVKPMDSVAETALQIAIANGNAIFPDSNKKNIKFFEGTAMLLKQSGSEELVGCKWIIGPILTCSIPLITLSADLPCSQCFPSQVSTTNQLLCFQILSAHNNLKLHNLSNPIAGPTKKPVTQRTSMLV